MKKNIKISKGVIYRIKNCDKNPLKSIENKAPKVIRLKKMSPKDIKKFYKLTDRTDPPTQNFLAKKFGVNQKTISHHINKTLNKKIRKKGLVHVLTDKNIAVRKVRSLSLYKILNRNKW